MAIVSRRGLKIPPPYRLPPANLSPLSCLSFSPLPLSHPFSIRRPFRRRTVQELSRVVQVVSLHPRPKRVPVREAVFLVFNVDIPPVSQPSEAAKWHSRDSCRFPSPVFLPTTRPHPAFAFLASNPLRSLRFSLRAHCSPLAPKIFSNHWKNRAVFSNHWKGFFQSLENWGFAGELADCAGVRRRGGRRGGGGRWR